MVISTPAVSTFYIHVRAAENARAFTMVGPYSTVEAAEKAAVFAGIPFFRVIEQQG